MTQPVLLRVKVTGIVAIVPSKADPDLTRVLVPDFRDVRAKHPRFPEHFAYLEISSTNIDQNQSADPFLKYRRDDDERWVYILNGEEVSLGTQPLNKLLIKSAIVPEHILKPNDDEKESPVYELRMEYLRHCPPIAEKYFHIKNSAVAARMDLRGGYESVEDVKDHVWDLPGTQYDQPYAEKIVYTYGLPSAAGALLLKRWDDTTRHIYLKPDDNGRMEVTLGNAPLAAMMGLDTYLGSPSEEHFKLIYDLFERHPWWCPVPKLKKGGIKFHVGIHDNCKPPFMNPQDPTT